MKKTKILFMLLLCAFMSSAGKAKKSVPLYKNAKAPVSARVDDLLSRMTLEEKIGQMNQLVGIEHFKANSKSMTAQELATNTANAFYPGIIAEDMEEWTRNGLVGSFLHVLTAEEANSLQRLNMQSRLQIPLIFGIDAIHGNAKCQGNTVYPTNIGLACSFDTLLAHRIARETAEEMRAMNLHWTFNPNVEVARDARWGRCGETFGEDPYLVTAMGLATTLGYQGDLNSENDVLACIKHLVGGSYSINGTNGAPCDVSERTLRETFFPPFMASVVRGNGLSVMMSHNELNGTPCHTNRWLMEDVLRKEWGFKGFVVTDWMDLEHCVDQHCTAKDIKEAFLQGINAGIDMHMHGPEWNRLVAELVKEGKISEERIDESVRRILTVKFRMGLFEHPYSDEGKYKAVINSPVHKSTALEAARKSIVLLKNDNSLLPLDAAKYKKVLVTGINANDQNIMGDWSEPQPEGCVTTVLGGLRAFSPETEFKFVDQGWNPQDMSQAKVDEAVAAAAGCDLNIVCCGEYMMRFRWKERTCGEDTDRDNIDLVGLQNQLIERLQNTGKPTVLIVISGRPLSINYAAENIPAILYAWEPGQKGGQAIAEILYGAVNPSAKLSMTIPRNAGQASVWYNHKKSAYFHPVACTPKTPLYPFGFGLSYTSYSYDGISLSAERIKPGESTDVSVRVTNTGNKGGEEIVQLYIRDVVSSVSRPVKELKDFRRVALKAGESKTIRFTVSTDKLAFLDENMNETVEKGQFEIQIGGSSEDKNMQRITFEVE